MNESPAMTLYSRLFLLGLLGVVVAGLLLSPFPALAVDLQAQTEGVSKQISIVPKFMALVSYIIGTFFAVRGLFALKGFIQAPDDNPLAPVIGFLAVSSLLIFLPFIINLTAHTIMLGDAPTVSSTSASFNPDTSCTKDGTLNGVFCRLAVSFGPYASLLAKISYVMAAVMTLIAFMNLKAYGDDPSSMPIRSIIVKFVLAVMLISLPLAMQTFVTSVTGEDSIKSTVTIKKPSAYRGSIK